GAVGRARTRTDDRDTRAIEELERRGAAHEQAERRIVNLSQPRRKAGVASRDEAQARGGESRSVRRLVEARPEALEAERPRLVDEMRPRLGREHRCGERIHSTSSAGGRYDSASATCSASTPPLSASAAIDAATRATRARPRPESGSRST